MDARKKPRLPNPPRSARLTKKLATEAMRVIDIVHWSLFATGVLDRPALRLDPKWLMDLNDRLVDCSAGLHRWHDAEKEKGKNRKALKTRRLLEEAGKLRTRGHHGG